MPPLTELLDKPIRDPHGDEVARLQDVVVRIANREENATPSVDLYPPVIGLVARIREPHGSRDVFIPWDQIESLGPLGASLKSPAVNLLRFAKRDGEIVLRGGLFDKQVVDVEGRRVVRINDLDLAERNGVWRLMAVDVSATALMRRLGAGRLSGRVAALLGREPGAKAPLIDWAMVYPVAEAGAGEEGALRLRVPRKRLDILHPADLAGLLEQLTPQQGADLLKDVDDERAADTLEELENERQAQILRAMDPERAADVLEEMDPDEATDALQGVTSEEMADLLRRMDRDEAEDVRELLGYPEDTAGGIMTTDYISVPEWATVGEVITALRERERAAAAEQDEPLPDAMPELYVIAEDRPPQRPITTRRSLGRLRSGAFRAPLTSSGGRHISLEAEGRLLGIVDLRALLLADPEERIASAMREPEAVAHPHDDQQDVAHVIADHDLLALPVVDDDSKMLGIVTVDDAIDVILPTAWKKRIPRRFR